jgi:fermentation-respiration switch protein FrsA (DUF1100 family)
MRARRVMRCFARIGSTGARALYLGESLGGTVALALALAQPPAGLTQQSTFTSVRTMARLHQPFLPSALVPNAYPTLRLIRRLRAPLLVLHGDRDRIVPLADGRALFDAAPGGKRMEVLPGAAHNDVIERAGSRRIQAIATWARGLSPAGHRPSP